MTGHRLKLYVIFWSAALILCSISGCALTTMQTVRYLSLDYQPPEPENRRPFPATLMVYRVISGPNVDSFGLKLPDAVRERSAVGTYRWEDSPADMITHLLLRDIAKAGIFQKTTDQSGESTYRFALEGTLQKIGGLAEKDRVLAVLEAEFVLIDFEVHGSASQEPLKRTYQLKVPCKGATSEAITEGLNQAMKEMSGTLRRDIQTTLDNMDESKPPLPRKPPAKPPRKRGAGAGP